MQKQTEIKSAEDLIEYLNKNGIEDPVLGFDYQLQTNYGFVYYLENGKIVFLPNDLQSDGLLIENKEVFDKIIEADYFPIEEEFKNYYESEIGGIKRINEEIKNYQLSLNKILKFDFQEINKEAAQAYLKKIVGRTIKNVVTDKEIIGLIAIIGELIKRDVNGKWFILKRYGKYNPYFEPNIITENGKVILVSSKIISQLKWKLSSLDSIFNKLTLGGINGGIEYEQFNMNGDCKIIE